MRGDILGLIENLYKIFDAFAVFVSKIAVAKTSRVVSHLALQVKKHRDG